MGVRGCSVGMGGSSVELGVYGENVGCGTIFVRIEP